MDEKERLLAILAKSDIEGLDITEGIGRFGGNPSLYAKIIKTFVDNIGAHLDTLAGLTEETLADYAIEIHGVKGSCYGISAKKEGDMAKELEIAAKAGDYEKVLQENAPFIAAMKELSEKLGRLLEEINSSADGGGQQRRYDPDRTVLREMLEASRDFDVNKMQAALQKLEKYEYDVGGDLVKWLSEQVTTFGYDKIEERLSSIL